MSNIPVGKKSRRRIRNTPFTVFDIVLQSGRISRCSKTDLKAINGAAYYHSFVREYPKLKGTLDKKIRVLGGERLSLLEFPHMFKKTCEEIVKRHFQKKEENLRKHKPKKKTL